jgi:tRNA1(Val) A37 N6-methylase TrmN6
MSDERFLGGRVIVRQSATGFRAGLDAVMLAAAVPGEGEVLELGAGVGTASLCLAARIPDVVVMGLEIDPALVDLANANAGVNGMAGRVQFAAADVFDLPEAYRRQFNHVLTNPPFHGEDGQAAPDPAKARALQDGGRLGDWLMAGMKRTASGGTFTAILRADRLAEALAALPERGVTVFPLWPKAGVEAKRVILQVWAGSRAPARLLAGMVLHQGDGTWTPEADAVLRGGASLALDSRPL